MATSPTLGVYKPIFYANEALIHLENALGMASRIHRGFDAERRVFDKGDVVSIRKPGKFSVQNAPGTAENVVTETVNITLNKWKEVKFKLSDKDLSFADAPRIINDHIKPAAYALANYIDQDLATLYGYVPWLSALTGSMATPAMTDIIGPRKILAENGVPMNDGNIHYMVDPTREASFQNSSIFHSAHSSADGGMTQRTGHIGRKFGVEIFMNQNVQTSGTASTLTDTAGACDGAVAKGATSMTIDGLADTNTIAAGDVFHIAGNDQKYVVLTGGTVATNEVAVTFYPATVQAYADNSIVTITSGRAKVENLMFHRNAFALVMAPLSNIGAVLDARVASVYSKDGSVAIRSRMYYVPDSSEVHVALDVLYGFAVLDGNMAVRGQGATS